MGSVTADTKKSDLLVGMGQAFLIRSTDTARAVLGSCIGLVLRHEARKLAAVAHIVLPEGSGSQGAPGKFANTAIPHMLALLAEQGGHRSGLTAKMTGGANMLSGSGPIQIGLKNHAAVKSALADLKIPLLGEHVGGQKGRRITFHGCNGELLVEVLGEPKVVL